MDLAKTIEDLRQEKEELDRVIAALEEIDRIKVGTAAEEGRRGRKFRTGEERRENSGRKLQLVVV